MSRFLTELDLRDDLGGHNWQLFAPLVYQSDLLGRTITVPQNFETDLASIPRALWIALPPVGKYDRAAVVHDWLYRTPTECVTRAQADAVLREACRVCGCSRLTCFTIWSGVRVGGFRAFQPRAATCTAGGSR